jgi:hypothetical protein
MLKLKFVVWRQKMGKREARRNEIKGELNDLLDVAPFPTFINEAIYHHHLIIY